jgi:hypothetical protein
MAEFTKSDEVQLAQRGISLSEAARQLAQLREGVKPTKISAPATVGQGLLQLSPIQQQEFHAKFKSSDNSRIKFVPASGAATRMFKFLQEYRTGKGSAEAERFFDNIRKLPIGIKSGDRVTMMHQVFDVMQLDKKPKAIVGFHQYGNEVRTALDEQVLESDSFVQWNDEMNFHFTVSDGHEEEFEEALHKHKTNYEAKGISLNYSLSLQSPATDTLAIELAGGPFRIENGSLLFRPSGHGALLPNLNALDSDIIFIKNIDNVAVQSHHETIGYWKNILAGVLIDFQQHVFELLKKNDRGISVETEAIGLLERMGLKGIAATEAIAKLNRPIRVCGMVKNIGEPGGGPFWVKHGDGSESLQIVEASQVSGKADQMEIFKSSTHFNPVDLVCGVRDYKGQKFDLEKYSDPNAGFVSLKSHEGRELKALERPGLWNGAMADWSTVFVEVPLETFNPVKTVNDLLRSGHQL